MPSCTWAPTARASVLFDQQQLARAVGPEAAARAWDAIGSAMARPPKKREDEAQQPSTESRSSQTPIRAVAPSRP